MRRSLVGAVLFAVLVIVATADSGSSESAYSLQVAPPTRGEGLITHVTATDGQSQVVTVVEPRQGVMAVYHVDRTTGEITLKSVRNITWDLQMIEFNSGDPLPQDIRSGLQR